MNPRIKTRVIQADFSNASCDYFEGIRRQVADLNIALLVVNAGAMATGRFVKQPESALQQMLDANVYHFAAMLK